MNYFIISLLLFLAFGGCEHPHFISDAEYRIQVRRDFDRKRELLIKSPENLLGIFDTPMNWEEREAMEFLYAYSPLVDISMQSGEFFLKNVRASFQARKEMPWGKNIPEVLFRHYVLPIRGGKEALDSSRMVFYRELKERVKKCNSMDKAALEVNHWCHEKVIYKPTDARTFSPLATLRTAYGRCGEESVFTLAALRAVAIPARQIYTPRWAHCDDNHAWIEVWVDGEWKYLGACEPEPRLNMAWFTVPVQRAVYVEADVFGKYKGDEEVVFTTPNSTGINVTAHYTKTKPTVVRVVDTLHRPIEGAKIEYKLFNYGEYYPVATLDSDERGESRLTLGLGDLIVWASKSGEYGYAKFNVGVSDSLVVVLDRYQGSCYAMEFDLVPPAAEPVAISATSSERAENDRRFAREDSLRNTYIASFIQEREALETAKELGVEPEQFSRFCKISRGNYNEIVRFMQKLTPKHREIGMELLSVVPEKDLQDTPAEVWESHVNVAWKFKERPFFKEYILNPRVRNELITAYRPLIADYLVENRINSVGDLMEEMKHIKETDSIYPSRILTPPEGVVRTRFADSRSKDVFFVAVCRVMGVPARINSISGKPEYYENNEWTTWQAELSESVSECGNLRVRYLGKEIKDPNYFLNFTIAKLENGNARTIDLGSNAAVDMGAGASLKSIFAKPVALDEGDYVLITGNRKSDGAVLSDMTSFRVKAGQLTALDMHIPEYKETIQVVECFQPDLLYGTERNQEQRLKLPPSGYTVLALIETDKEPTNHLLRDVSGMKEDFDNLGVPFTFLFRNEEQWNTFNRADFRPFPSVLNFGYDKESKIWNVLEKTLNVKAEQFPCIVVLNREGEVIFVSQGYRVGLGSQLLKMMQLK